MDKNLDKSYYDKISKFLEQNLELQNSITQESLEFSENLNSVFEDFDTQDYYENKLISVFGDESFVEKANKMLPVKLKQMDVLNDIDASKVYLNTKYSEYNSADWEDIEPKQDKFLWIETGSYIYTASDGTKIKLDDIENVIVRQNKKTGEIIIIGAKDAEVTTGKKDANIKIFDSEISKFESKSGDDKVYIENSIVKTLETGKGNDDVTIRNSTVSKIDTSSGLDTLIIEDSTITKKIETGASEDFVYINNSTVERVETNTGDDEILVENSQVNVIDAGMGDDTIVINKSDNIKKIRGFSGNDIINLIGSHADEIEGGIGRDTYINENSTVGKISGIEAQTSGNILENPGGIKIPSDSIINSALADEISPYEQYSDDTIKESSKNVAALGEKYGLYNLTPEQEVQVLALNHFTEDLESMIAEFEKQENEDGKCADSFNWVKELVSLGISKEDIRKAIHEQKQMVSELEAAIKGEGKLSFEETFKKWTGVEFNQENFIEYQELLQLYGFAEAGIKKAEIFKENVHLSENLKEVFDYFVNYYGSEERALIELNNRLEITPNMSSTPNERIRINSNFQVEISVLNPATGKYEYSRTIPMDESECIAASGYLGLVADVDYVSEFEKKMNISFEELQNNLRASHLKTFGKSGSFQKLIDRYCDSQKGFADTIATFGQHTGIGLMIVGGIVTFIPSLSVASGALYNAGRFLATISTFSDNALEIFDDITSENGCSQEKAFNVIKETLIDIVNLYSGAKINGVSQNAKNIVLDATKSKVLSFFAEVGADATLSLLADLAITGEISLTSEGINQILGILTGLAGAKVDTYTKNALDASLPKYNSGDYEAVLEDLQSKGIPRKKINLYFKSLEMEKYNKYFDETGDFIKTLSLAKQSPFLKSGDIENLDIGLQLKVLKNNGYDVTKYFGYDFSCPQGKLVAADIEMMYEAVTKGINVNDLMVPSYKSVNEGVKNVKFGDVFEVISADGKNELYYRTENGYEKLNISKETYCKLFPPIDRYSSGQQYSGDCYLISSLNSMMSRPSTRKMLLSCFSEDENGSIIVTMPDDTKVVLRDGQTLEDVGVDVANRKCAKGALGIQLLEYVYKKSIANNYVNGELNRLTRERDIAEDNLYGLYAYHRKFWAEIGVKSFDDFYANLDSAKANNVFKAFENNYNVKFSDIESDLQYFIAIDRFHNTYSKDGKLTQEGINKLGQILNINDSDLLQKIYQEELIPALTYYGAYRLLLKIEECNDKIAQLPSPDEIFEQKAGNGGYSSDVFTAFGLDATPYYGNNMLNLLDKAIANPSAFQDKIMTASTPFTKEEFINKCNDPSYPNYEYYKNHPEEYQKKLDSLKPEKQLPKGIVGGHCYSFEIVVNSDGEILIEVVNPWASANSNNKSTILTLDEFKKYFDTIFVAQMP